MYSKGENTMKNLETVITNDKQDDIDLMILDSQKLIANTQKNLVNSQEDINKAIEKICDIVKKQNGVLTSVKKDTEDNTKDIKKLKKNTDVICSPFHSKRKRDFKNICKSRVWFLFNNDKTSCDYVLFNSFLFKKIYADIAVHFDLDTWYDLSMENYELENSIYSQAKEFATYWTPSSWYIKECIKDMVVKRDNGLLSPERCRALTEYLKFTNNGEVNPFSS